METKTDIHVELVGENGNAFNILGIVRKALKAGGRADLVEAYTEEATSGDYDHLLQVTMTYVIVD